jgi:hypothetical protein
MKIPSLDYLKSRIKTGIDFFSAKDETSKDIKSNFYQEDVTYGVTYPIVNKKWDGEKTLGELGVIINNIPDYKRLRLRSYNAYATIDTVKIIASKYFYWTVGSGLKLQSEPNRTVLVSEGIKNDKSFFADFQKNVEARFMIYANSKECHYLKEKTLHELALDFFQGTFLGGDTLCIGRYDDKGPNVQFVSGDNLCNPELGSEYYALALKNGNYIENGIEIDKKGSHVAYYVTTKSKVNGVSKTERILAKGAKTGKTLAWLISGDKLSPDHLRGVPAMSQSLEKINKLDRYTEASVSKAEQAAKILLAIEHEEFSTGENPLDDLVKKKQGIVASQKQDSGVLGDGLAIRIAESTSNKTFNMPNGASLKSFTTSIETSFQEFNGAVFNSISAGMNVPPEVAMQSYNSNYSASRAAINSFGYIISVNRNRFANQFYVPFFKLWLEYEILNNKIKAPGYFENVDNFMITESYSQCRFIGKNMPHIDPLKEIKAVREMLGVDDTTALISREQATEMLNAGQWDENFMKSLEEENIIPKEEPIINDKKSKNGTNKSNVTE